MKILHSVLHIGAEKPFSFLHFSDTHITLADARDNERKRALAVDRLRGFPEAEAMLEDIRAYTAEHKMFAVNTGDLIDFVSVANLDRAHEFVTAVDCFTAAGNHEYSQYVGEAWEDEAYRNQSLEKVQAAYTNDIRFSSRIENGVNFVAVDNGYYLFDAWQLDRLRAEVEKGYPVILCMHTPLYEEQLYDYMRSDTAPGTPAYLMSVPDEKMSYYTPDRYKQQKEDDVTREAYAYIKGEKRIRAILVGHLHRNFEFPFDDRRIQYGVDCTTVRVFDVD